jgi:SAM-dependent methyltransferase
VGRGNQSPFKLHSRVGFSGALSFIMRRAIATSVRVFSDVFKPKGPVIEIGSLYLPGYEQLSNLRPLFPGCEYTGCDLRQGLGVDRIEDAENLSFADRSVGTVLMFEILEHLPNPHKAVSEARRVLSDDGVLALSVPFNYRLHGFPTDYWRFTASGIYQLLADFPQKTVFSLGPRVKPSFIFAVARKNVSSDFAAAQARFADTIQETFRRSRQRGFISALKERGREFFGLILGRAHLGVSFYDPSQPGGYFAPKTPR